ncbi:hypothetical protein [Kibdelosporangium phytohabitans]|uniref:hypothetical protein n=1 Tax=Kibdelosporangium phytohabitans TaxID=860235 RepID=UPI0007C7C7F6|nr:hypothetical protein [Kibdelosporangium phytohabitans]MBE1461524.1 hypothetical protein [Kibdelosporangium phytohabitans]
MVEILGLALLIQGGGGLINNLSGGSKSWFLLNYVEMPTALHVAGHALLLVIGLVIVVRRKGWSWLKSD